MRSLALALALSVVAPACSSGRDRKPENDGPATVTTAATAAAVIGPAAAAKPLPPGRTPVPTLAEYAAAGEVTIKGSSALRCETKMIREWLRVSCRGKNDTGGTPTAVAVTRGGRGETITYAAGGVTNLITPVLDGTDFEARFSWTDKSHPLAVRWPRGAQRPIVLGEFLGAASPLDGTAPSALLCDCHKKLTQARDCSEAPLAHPDCERTYAGDCGKLIACAHGQPGAWPTCTAGKRNAAVTGWCATICGPGKPPCGQGTECTRDWGDPPVCL